MRLAATLLLSVFLTLTLLGKKKKEDETQVLELPKESPPAIVVETRRLVFHVTPLSGKGLLSQQTRDAIRSMFAQNKGLEIMKVRAFVAGSGDLRRIPSLVSEIFTEKHLPLPAVSVIQAGGLGLENAQVVLESTAMARREVNPGGLAFIPAQTEASEKPLEPLGPYAEKAVAAVRAAAGPNPELQRVTCFVTALDPQALRILSDAFSATALNIVQAQREPLNSYVSCEGIAKLVRESPGAIAVTSPKLLLTGLQLAFGAQDADAKLAFDRFQKTLAQSGTSLSKAVELHLYPLSNAASGQLTRLSAGYLDPARPPALTRHVFEGLPGVDATFAIEATAVINQ